MQKVLAKVTSHAEPLAVCVTQLRAVSPRPEIPGLTLGTLQTTCERVGRAVVVVTV